MSTKPNQFQTEMEKYLIDFKEQAQFLPATNDKKRWYYYDISDNLYPPLKHSFLQYAYDAAIPFHDFSNHVRSSQVFGFNLFYPMLVKEPWAVLDCFNQRLQLSEQSIVEYHFEYSPEKNWLGEWRNEGYQPDEYVTASDIAIITADREGKQTGFLIEVKFTEDAFTQCGGYQSNGNKGETKVACEERSRLFQDKDSCYLKIPTRGKTPRKYFDYFDLQADFPGHPEIQTCPFQANHQCVRNHAFARALVENKKCQRAYFGLTFHDDNKSIKTEWEQYLALVSDQRKYELFSLTAGDLLRYSGNETLKRYFRERYRVGEAGI